MPATDIVTSFDAAHLCDGWASVRRAAEIQSLTGLTRQAAVASVMVSPARRQSCAPRWTTVTMRSPPARQPRAGAALLDRGGNVSLTRKSVFFGGGPAFAGPPLGPSDRILVLIEFDGGNDGLNTLIPYANSSYYGLRGGLAIAANAVLPLGEGLGLPLLLRGSAAEVTGLPSWSGGLFGADRTQP